MTGRLKGLITLTFSDGYIEKCEIKERADKGMEHFISLFKDAVIELMKDAEPGDIHLNYKGDFATEIYERFKMIEKDLGKDE